MQACEQLVIVIVAVASIAWMSFMLVRLFGHRAVGRAIPRTATAVESGLVGGTVPEGAPLRWLSVPGGPCRTKGRTSSAAVWRWSR